MTVLVPVLGGLTALGLAALVVWVWRDYVKQVEMEVEDQ